MSFTPILQALALVGGVGLFVGIFLGIAYKRFYVKVDEREEAVLAALPGANCGGCGYSGCAALAAAIAKGEAPVNSCPVGQKPVADEIAKIMGTTAAEEEKKVAFVRCTGNCEKTSGKYIYTGTENCRMATFAPGRGPKSCAFGCAGLGDCVKACEFGALSIQEGIAQVDPEKCRDCRKCMKVCPKHLITEIPYSAVSRIGCSNPGKGKPVMDNCKVGCISCTMCARNCPAEAIEMVDGLPVIDYGKCTGCGLCKEKCPRGCLV